MDSPYRGTVYDVVIDPGYVQQVGVYLLVQLILGMKIVTT